MQIAFITDFHTGKATERPFEVDVRQNFLKMVDFIRNRPFELLVVGGDLCLYEGSAEIYDWQKKALDSLHRPYHIIAGNHDDKSELSSVFNELILTAQDEIYYDLVFDQVVLLFLDTAKKQTSDQQKSWIRNKLNEHQGRQILIFMHHPPALMGVPFMDNEHALKDRNEILSIFLDAPDFLHIFCGHYHVEKSAFIRNVAIHITPSLYVQIDPFVSDFQIDHRRCAYRMIEISSETLRTSVHYLE